MLDNANTHYIFVTRQPLSVALLALLEAWSHCEVGGSCQAFVYSRVFSSFIKAHLGLWPLRTIVHTGDNQDVLIKIAKNQLSRTSSVYPTFDLLHSINDPQHKPLPC